MMISLLQPKYCANRREGIEDQERKRVMQTGLRVHILCIGGVFPLAVIKKRNKKASPEEEIKNEVN